LLESPTVPGRGEPIRGLLECYWHVAAGKTSFYADPRDAAFKALGVE
jgi:hypothetical protein